MNLASVPAILLWFGVWETLLFGHHGIHDRSRNLSSAGVLLGLVIITWSALWLAATSLLQVFRH